MSFAYHDHAMGTAVYAGIREALDSLGTQGGPILACGRDVFEGARTMGLPVSCRRPGWQHRRLPTQPDQRRRGSQSVFPQGASYPTTRAGQYYVGWLHCIAASSARDARVLNPEQVRCSALRILIAQSSPSPASNCAAVFAKDNSPWGVYVSKTKLPPQSGMRYSPHSPYFSPDLAVPILNICTRTLHSLAEPSLASSLPNAGQLHACRDQSFLNERLSDYAPQPSSSPTEPAPLERQGANSLASGGEDGIAHRGQNRLQCRLAQPGWRVVGLAPIDFDLRHLPHAHQRVVMEVRLLDLAILQRDFLRQVAHAFHDAALRHALSRVGVDDLATYIPSSPDLMHRDLVLRINAHVGNFGEVAQMAKPRGNSHAAARLLTPLGPA